MKRIITLLLCCVLVCSVIPGTAYATSSDVVDAIEQQTSDLGTYLGIMGADINDWLSSINSYWEQYYNEFFKTDFAGWLSSINYWLETIDSSVNGFETEFIAWMETVLGNVDNWIKQLSTTVDGVRTGLASELAAWMNTLLPALTDWWGQQLSKMDTLIKGTLDQVDKVIDFGVKIDKSEQDFNDSFEQISEATRPTISDSDIIVDDHVDQSALSSMAEVFSHLLTLPPIYDIFAVAFIFSLVSYGVFGKRG